MLAPCVCAGVHTWAGPPHSLPIAKSFSQLCSRFTPWLPRVLPWTPWSGGSLAAGVKILPDLSIDTWVRCPWSPERPEALSPEPQPLGKEMGSECRKPGGSLDPGVLGAGGDWLGRVSASGPGRPHCPHGRVWPPEELPGLQWPQGHSQEGVGNPRVLRTFWRTHSLREPTPKMQQPAEVTEREGLSFPEGRAQTGGDSSSLLHSVPQASGGSGGGAWLSKWQGSWRPGRGHRPPWTSSGGLGTGSGWESSSAPCVPSGQIGR